MRDPERIPRILELLRRKWQQEPDQRLGQLIENSAHILSNVHREPAHCIYNVEDDVMEKALGGPEHEPGNLWTEPNAWDTFLSGRQTE